MTHFKTEEDYQIFLTRKSLNKCIQPPGDDTPDPGPENDLQTKCQDWLKEKNHKYIHVRGKKNDAGILDLNIFLPKRRFVAIELKSKRGRMSREQKLWVSYLNYHGYSVYPGVKSYKRFLEIMAKELST